jgi:DNA-binding response OmpR family regulator
MDTLASELREAAEAIDRAAHGARCWSVISEAVNACTDHILMIAANIELRARIHELEAGNYDDPMTILARITMGPVERRVAVALARRFGEWTTTEHILQAAYADRADGGPISARNTLSVTVHNLRQKLRPERLTIQGAPYSGRRMIRI